MSIRLAQERAPNYPRGLVWLRRDLRAQDQAALYHALKSCQQVFVAFVFDTELLAPWPRSDRRVEFILASLQDVDADLRRMAQAQGCSHAAQTGLIVRHGQASEEIPKLAAMLGVQAVFCNREYEPAAIARDRRVRGTLANLGVMLHHFKDQVIFEREELPNPMGKAYTRFNAYRRAWLEKLSPFALQAYPCANYAQNLAALPPALQAQGLPQLHDLDFQPSNLAQLKIPTGSSGAAQMLAHFLPHMAQYDHARHYPALRGVSYLGLHLRFGTLSIRQAAQSAYKLGADGQAWLDSLIWRDFYTQILALRPDLARGKSYRPAYDRLIWTKGSAAKKLFSAWCQGQTGYPIVDAAMRQLEYSGYMHPRLRLIAGSFLCKHLGLDWRWGQDYFAQKLNDFDLALSNGGWQWLVGSGCEALPHYRVLNPVLQSQKYDPQGQFISRYVPELATLPLPHLHAPWQAEALELQSLGLKLGSKKGDHYPLPIVTQQAAQEQTQARYASIQLKASR